MDKKEKHVKSINISTTPLEINNRTYKAIPVWKTKMDFGVDENSVVSNLIMEENPTHLVSHWELTLYFPPWLPRCPGDTNF